MKRRNFFRHPLLGKYRQLDLSRGSLGSTSITDAELKGLTQYLDRASASKKENDVLRILKEMLELEKLKSPLWGETKEELQILNTSKFSGGISLDPRLKKLVPNKYATELEIETKKNSINNRLSHYTFTATVVRSMDRQWVVIWQIQLDSRQKVSIGEGVHEMTDGMVLQRILDLGRAGYLSRLRRCSYCKKWIFANYRHQNFCSQSCQQKSYARDPEQKRKRRDYMRNYREYSV